MENMGYMGYKEKERESLLVPHLPEEARLGLLIVEALAPRHGDGIVVALLVHEALEVRAGGLREGD